MEMDIEDFLEEVKFQMTEYDCLTEEMILGWEKKTRVWIGHNKKRPYFRYCAADNIQINIKNEKIMEEIARKFYQAIRDEKENKYWKNFYLL